jgi:hypothetical protein
MSPVVSATIELADLAKKYLNPQQKALITDVEEIINGCYNHRDQISDFSFLVAPAAKAYEGYLKEFFLRIKSIDRHTYNSDRFRVGKTLNPSLRYKRFSIFQRLSSLHDEGEKLAESLWNAWKYGRNQIFHYFPSTTENLTLDQAVDRINLILRAIDDSGKFCDALEDEPYNM